MPVDPQGLYARGLISDPQMQKLMTHNAPQPNPAQPYLDAAQQFAHGGISEVLQNRGAQPDWMKTGDFLHSDAANMALGVMEGGLRAPAAQHLENLRAAGLNNRDAFDTAHSQLAADRSLTNEDLKSVISGYGNGETPVGKTRADHLKQIMQTYIRNSRFENKLK